MTNTNEIDQAIQQFTGFLHGRSGFSIVELVRGMGLTKAEWKIIQNQIPLNQNDKNEINDYFKN